MTSIEVAVSEAKRAGRMNGISAPAAKAADAISLSSVDTTTLLMHRAFNAA